MSIILDETKTARRLGEAVQAHHKPLNLAALGEELVHLLLSCVEGSIRMRQKLVLERVRT